MTFPIRSTALLVALTSLGLAPWASGQSTNWISQFGTIEFETGTQVAADGAGGAFAATNSGPQIFGTTDVLLAGYDAAGLQAWTRTLASAGRDEAWGAASDGAGGFLVCGSTTGALGGTVVGSFDGWVGSFDAAGSEIWLTQFGSTSLDTCLAVVPDGAGGAFACGYTQGDLTGTPAISADAWLAHFDGTGAITWIRQLDSTGSDSATDLVPDGSGGVYVCGTSSGELFGFSSGDVDAWLARYGAAGNPLWGEQWGSADSETAVRVASNGTAGVFVAGVTDGLLGGTSAGGSDVWITRFSDTGSQTWLEQFGTSESDLCTDMASDLSGGFYLMGSTSGLLGSTAAGGLDTWVARHDDAGNQSWLRQFGTAGVDRPGGLSVGQPGQLFLGGSTGLDLAGPSAGQEDAFIASFDSLVSESYCSSPANSTGAPASITAGGSSAIALNRLSLRAESLPRFGFGFFIVSRDQNLVLNPAGSQGNLCLGGSIGRYVGPGQVQNSGSAGVISLDVDPSALPQPLGPASAQPGETWSFQIWFRDANPLPTSNFSDGVAVTFL